MNRTKLAILLIISLISLAIPISLISAGAGDLDLNGRDLFVDLNSSAGLNAATDDQIQIIADGTSIPSIIRSSGVNTSRFFGTSVLSDDITIETGTFTNTGLAFTLPTTPTSKYYVEIVFNWSQGTSTQTGAFRILAPTNVTFDGLWCYNSTSSSPTDACEAITETTQFTTKTENDDGVYTIKGSLVSPGTLSSSTVNFQWAQNTTDAGNPHTMFEGSYLIYSRGK